MIEWCASSYFSFLEGTGSPSDLIKEAEKLGYEGLALGDRMGLYGLVEAQRARDTIEETSSKEKFFYAPGIRLHFDHADPLFVYPLHKKSYGDLCVFLSDWALEGLVEREKGLPPLPWSRFRDFLRAQKESLPKDSRELRQHFLFFSVSGRFYPWPESHKDEFKRTQTQDLMRVAPSFSVPPTQNGQCPFWMIELAHLCASQTQKGEDSALSLVWPLTLAPGVSDLQSWLFEQSRLLKVPLVASTLPLFTHKEDCDLAQLTTAIRHRKHIQSLGLLGQVNSQRRLLNKQEKEHHLAFWKEFLEIEKHDYPFADPFQRSVDLAQRHSFHLKELNYRYPSERIPEGETASAYFKRLVYEGAQRRYPEGVHPETEKQITKEIELIRGLGFEDYFLTIYDILDYARSQKILFQGRGSAANSAVCYCLGITSIDPIKMNLLFERFISAERHEAPDIDIDFEHERREEVIQEVYSRYGRNRSAMVANTIRFRGRMAVRETGKALGLTDQELSDLTDVMGREGFSQLKLDCARNTLPNFIPQHIRKILPQLIHLSQKLIGSPRHLGIHSCGFVLSNDDLRAQCILEPARKEMRSVIPWNKDDVDYLNWVKVDLLSLGMLTALRKCFDLIGEQNSTGQKLQLHSIPQDCAITYKAIQRADTVGVFQIESRAQMNMLPRLAPKNFYDLVIEVAIVRPGPIQGGMVHPYLRRRQGLDKWNYDHPSLEPILKKTLGIPIFQEQVMRMAVAIGGFTAGEADQMRKVMSGAWRSKSEMHKHKDKLFTGMAKNGIKKDYAERIYKQMEGFGEYGFPESHSASFAIITYVSSWIKAHHPAEFLCSLLNSQPMGFYSPRALVGDAKRHRVEVLPIDLFHSHWESTLAPNHTKQTPCVRLGLHQIKSFKKEEALLIQDLQEKGLLHPSRRNSIQMSDLRLHLQQSTLEKIVRAGAFTPQKEERTQQMWQLYKLRHIDKENPSLFKEEEDQEKSTDLIKHLPQWNEWESILADYKTSGLSLKRHPALYARTHFFNGIHSNHHQWINAEEVWSCPTGRVIDLVGLLAIKQKPPTAGGMCFLTLEDESGFFNLALKPKVYEAFRLMIDRAPLLAARGLIERSHSNNPNDPRSNAVSLNVMKLWNPFDELDPQKTPPAQPIPKKRHATFIDR